MKKTDYRRKIETKKAMQPDAISYGGDEKRKNARPVMYYTFLGTLADLTRFSVSYSLVVSHYYRETNMAQYKQCLTPFPSYHFRRLCQF